jgi:hypothetical protein
MTQYFNSAKLPEGREKDLVGVSGRHYNGKEKF